MSGAHRKPAHPIGTPSLLWHRGFWKSFAQKLSSTDEWIEAIEIFITTIVDKLDHYATHPKDHWPRPSLSSIHSEPVSHPWKAVPLLRNTWSKSTGAWKNISTGPAMILPGQPTSRYEAVQIAASWESIPILIRVEVFEEYFTLNVCIDLSFYLQRSKTINLDHEGPFEEYRALRDAVHAVEALVESRHARIVEAGPNLFTEKQADADILRESKHVEHLFTSIWSSIEKSIIHPAFDHEGSKKLGKVFADFRGLVLGRRDDEVALKLSRCNDHSGVPSSLSSRLRGKTFTDADATDCLDALFPVLLATEPEKHSDRSPLGSVDYAISMFCGRRAMYASAFGPQLLNQDELLAHPLVYVILASHDERRQIGRMISRLHTLGCVRLASLIGFRNVLIEDEKLPELRTKLQHIAFQVKHPEHGVTEYISALSKRNASNARFLTGKENRDLLLKQLDRVEAELESMDSSVGDIDHRRARLEYYLERFDTLAFAMRIDRIPGYQPYQEFVRHRIDRVHARIAAFSRRHAELTNEIAGLRAEIRRKATEEYMAEISAIQFFGEIFFLAVLLPYYTLALIEKAHFTIVGALPAFIVGKIPETDYTKVNNSVYYIVLAICAGLLLFRLRVNIIRRIFSASSRVTGFIRQRSHRSV